MKSSAFSDITYNGPSEILTVTYPDKSKWKYHNVSRMTYSKLQAAVSKGKFIAHYIKNSHRASRA